LGESAIVSILTGPEGPVSQRNDAIIEQAKQVSILTGPEGPVSRNLPHGQ
jgi:hypothetical protein